MKKLLFVIAPLAVCTLFSCHKSNIDGGSWVFKGVTYNSQITDYVHGSFIGFTNNNFPTGVLSFTFDTFGPGRFGQLLVSAGTPGDVDHVYVSFVDTSVTRVYSPLPGQTVYVTVSGDSTKRKVVLQPLLMSNGIDTGTMTASLIQTPR